jgi:hypothetical protein
MTDVAQDVTSPPAPGAAPGWRATSPDGLEIAYWDGAGFTAQRVWDGAEWRQRPDPADPLFAPMAEEGVPASQRPGDAWQPPRRKRRRGLVVVLVAAVVAAAGAGAGVVLMRRWHGGLTGKSAAQVLALSLAAARAQGSVHLAAVDSAGSSAVSSYDITATVGEQIVSGGQANATLLVLPGAAYLKADAPFLQNSLGLEPGAAARYAGQWISFKPGDPGYRQVVSGDTLPSALGEATPTGTLTLTPTGTVDGQQVVGVRGGLPADSASGARGSMTLYVSTAAPYLPVELVTQGSLAGQNASATVTFSRWRQPVSVTAPASATPFSSLSSAMAPSAVPG